MSLILQKIFQEQPDHSIKIYLQHPSRNTTQVCLLLSRDSVLVTEGGQINKVIEKLSLDDLIGYSVEEIEKETYHFQLNSFGKQKKWLRKQRRYLKHFQFWIKINTQDLQQLKIKLLTLITGRRVTNSTQPLKLIIYLNPKAGANSQSHFQTVRQFITYTNFTYDLIQTTHRGHCKEHLSTIDITSYQGVVIISGDGLMHQFVNSSVCGKIPVTHVPGGSGNAFSKAQTTLADQNCGDQQTIFLAIKGRTREMNLMRMELEKETQPIYSFLSLEWAFLADIDMNSQFLRCLGGFRFQIFSAYRCICLKRYRGKLTYSSVSNYLPPLSQNITSEGYTTIQTQFLNAVFCSIPFISDKYQFAPLLKVQDEAADMQLITSQHGRWQLIKYLLSSDSGNHFDKIQQKPKEGFDFHHKKIKCYRLEPHGENEQEMGLFGIDGQRYEAQRIQATLSDRKVLTFA